MKMKAIVTGHTRGLGAAIAGELLNRGVAVLGLARGKSAELDEQFPALFDQVEIDLGDSTALAYWIAGGALKDFFEDASLALLVNNAGTVQPVGPLHEQDPLAVGRAVALNVAAPLMLAAAVVAATPLAVRRVLHVSSGAGSSGYPGWSVYGATKAALDHHARCAALDEVPGLRVCSLAPGVIDTAMQAEIRATPVEHFPNRQRFIDLERSGQLSTPQACATRLVDYLLSAAFGRHPVEDLRAVAE
ncbi:SDR family oxidoreductase [Massilia sp. TSP1-1-2]|uniref:SDR family oxidoreductase n=1 Tax=unclassified Massilia TaxID=2609279 RepID=UPI003CE89B2C